VICILCPNQRDSDFSVCGTCRAKFKLNPKAFVKERKSEPTPDIRGGGNRNGNGVAIVEEIAVGAEIPEFRPMYRGRTAG
jgi:hypothetical protein